MRNQFIRQTDASPIGPEQFHVMVSQPNSFSLVQVAILGRHFEYCSFEVSWGQFRTCCWIAQPSQAKKQFETI